LLIYLVLANVILALLYFSGQLRPETLARGPKRDIGLGGFDLALGVWLFFTGILVSIALLQAFLSYKGVDEVADLTEESQRVLGLTSQITMWGPGIAYFIIRVKWLKKMKDAGLTPMRPIRDLGVAAVAVPVMIVLTAGLSAVVLFANEKLGGPQPENGHALIGVLTKTESMFVILMLTFSAVVVAPVMEELFFRGFIQTALLGVFGQNNRWTAVLTTSVFFGVIHYGAVPWIMLPSLILVGIVLGWIYERTGSLLCCILVHMGFNGFNIAMALHYS